MVLVTDDRKATSEALVDEAARLGGWYESRTPERVVLRVPPERVEDLLSVVDAHGRVVDRLIDRNDLSDPLGELRSQIAADREMLARYQTELSRASTSYVLQLEATLNAQIAAVEQLEAQRLDLEESAKYAAVDVSFRLVQRAAPHAASSTPFAWLSSVDPLALATQVPGPAKPPRKVWLPAPPPGFSCWDSPTSAVSRRGSRSGCG